MSDWVDMRDVIKQHGLSNFRWTRKTMGFWEFMRYCARIYMSTARYAKQHGHEAKNVHGVDAMTNFGESVTIAITGTGTFSEHAASALAHWLNEAGE